MRRNNFNSLFCSLDNHWMYHDNKRNGEKAEKQYQYGHKDDDCDERINNGKKRRRNEKKKRGIVAMKLCVRLLTINSRRNLSSSRAAGDVPFKCCWILVVPLLPPLLMFKLFTEAAAAFAAFTPAAVDIKFSGPRRSRRNSSSCFVSASTFATAKLSSFSFSLNSARIESRSLPGLSQW